MVVKVEEPEVSTETRAEVVIAEEDWPAPAPPVAVVVTVPVGLVTRVVAVVVAAVAEPAPLERAAEQYEVPKAMTELATAAPQASLEQSRRPYPKFSFLHKHAASVAEHPRDGAKLSMLLTQV